MNYPSAAEQIIEAFNEVPDSSKLELLLEYSEKLPEIPADLKDKPGLLERVQECQSPVHLYVAIEENKVKIYLSAPVEAPTTRGFASILHVALNDLEPTQVLDFSEEFIEELHLKHLVSPLRIRGMQGMLSRIKRQTRERLNERN
jgi:cysteine desulfuration protein SufE